MENVRSLKLLSIYLFFIIFFFIINWSILYEIQIHNIYNMQIYNIKLWYSRMIYQNEVLDGMKHLPWKSSWSELGRVCKRHWKTLDAELKIRVKKGLWSDRTNPNMDPAAVCKSRHLAGHGRHQQTTPVIPQVITAARNVWKTADRSLKIRGETTPYRRHIAGFRPRHRLGLASHVLLFKIRPMKAAKSRRLAANRAAKGSWFWSRSGASELTAGTVGFLTAWSFHPQLPGHWILTFSHRWTVRAAW